MKDAVRRLVAAVAALVVAAVGPAWGQKLDRVRFGTNWVAEAEHLGFYQSVADGTYAKHRLDVSGLFALDFFRPRNRTPSFPAASAGCSDPGASSDLTTVPFGVVYAAPWTG